MGCCSWLAAIGVIALILVWLGYGSFVLGVIAGVVLLIVVVWDRMK